MESRAKFLGHAVHPMLIAFPLGLFSTAVLFDLIRLFHGGTDWGVAAFYDIAVGIAGGLLAALFGLIDWLAIPKATRARTVGAWHGLANFVIVVLFLVSWLLRLPDPGAPPVSAFVLALAGVLLISVTAWLGGELVERMRVGVDDDAGLNASPSVTARGGRRRIVE